MLAFDTDEQLTPETHFIVTVEGQLTHSQVLPDAWGHHIVIDLQSLKPEAWQVNLKEFDSLAFTVLYWYASWPLPWVFIVQSCPDPQFKVVDLHVLSLLDAPQKILYSPFHTLFLQASCPVQ